MRFVFFAPRYHTNQIGVVKALKDNKHQVHFWVINQGHIEDHSLLVPIVVKESWIYRLIIRLIPRLAKPDNRRKFLVPSVKQVVSLFQTTKPDTIVIRNPHYIPSTLLLLAAKYYRIKAIIYTQWPYHKTNLKLRERYLEFLNKYFGTISFTPVKANIGRGHRTIYGDNLIPFPIPISSNAIKKNNETSYNKAILCIGKFEQRKCHDLLIRAIARIKGSVKLLTIVGEVSTSDHIKNYKRIESLVRSLNLKELVEIKVNVAYKEIFNLYDLHDIFVLPSRNEPFATTVLEALGCGLPTICSDSCGSRWYIQDGVNGFVFKSNDIADLSIKIESAIERCDQLSKNALLIVAREYGSSKFYENFWRMVSAEPEQ